MDDVHTRGSDFRLPRGMRAAVTLGKGLQKDKLVQACMRMRQLGNGHTVCFFASFEVDLQIRAWREQVAGQFDFRHLPAIVSWCLSNTVDATCRHLPYLAAQGASQIRKQHAFTHLADNPMHRANMCAEEEVVKLSSLYGSAAGNQLLPDIVKKRLKHVLRGLGSEPGNIAVGLETRIVSHIESLARDVHACSQLLDEEQERELEEELEEEREIERPPAGKPWKPQFTKGLAEFAGGGPLPESVMALHVALEDTSFQDLLDGNWDESVFVTPDFVRTVEDKGDKDSFLKSVMWVVSAKVGHTVLVSNYEAEKLASFFMFRLNSKPNLHMVVPRLGHCQAMPLPSLLHHVEPPIAVRVFAGYVHGAPDDLDNVNFLGQLRSFLGLCEPQPDSLEWQRLYQAGLMQRDGFVLKEHRNDVIVLLRVPLISPFSKSPVRLLRRLYFARQLGDVLASSPVGKLLGCGDVCEAFYDSVPEPQAAADVMSVATDISHASFQFGGHQEPHCFVENTLFLLASGLFIPASFLTPSHLLMAASGRSVVEVVSVEIHEEKDQQLVMLQAGESYMVVSSDHRVMAKRGDRPQPVKACTLSKGDEVLCSGERLEALKEVSPFTEKVRLVEITFRPDEPVEAFHPPSSCSILTKGRGGAGTRRGGMRHRRADDLISFPDTASVISS